MKKRLVSLLLCGAMLFSLCTPVSAEEDGVNYRFCNENGQDWQTGTCSNYKAITADDPLTAWGAADSQEEHWYVARGGVTISSRVTVTVKGDVHLILVDGCSLTVSGGIQVLGDGSSLTIYGQERGTGKLTATGPEDSVEAGIGGGTITINGGTVRAVGGYMGGAGIGGTMGRGFKKITINGGNVDCQGGSSGQLCGAGIGSGYDYTDKDKGEIIINGGTVTAVGTGDAAGIGDGASSGGCTFSTGANGSAIIFASSISDKTNRDNWSGIIFDGNNGIVGGNQTLKEDLEITDKQTLTIQEGSSLTFSEDVALINNGTLTINGALKGNVTNYGNVNGSGTADPKIVPSAPKKGEGYTIDYLTETISIDAGYEVDGLTTGAAVPPGTAIKCRRTETGIFFQSGWSAEEFKTPDRRPAPTVSIDYIGENLKVDAGADPDDEIVCRRDGIDWRLFSGFEDLGWDGTTAVTIYVRIGADRSNYASEAQEVTIPARPAAPTGLVGVAPTTKGGPTAESPA